MPSWLDSIPVVRGRLASPSPLGAGVRPPVSGGGRGLGTRLASRSLLTDRLEPGQGARGAGPARAGREDRSWGGGAPSSHPSSPPPEPLLRLASQIRQLPQNLSKIAACYKKSKLKCLTFPPSPHFHFQFPKCHRLSLCPAPRPLAAEHTGDGLRRGSRAWAGAHTAHLHGCLPSCRRCSRAGSPRDARAARKQAGRRRWLPAGPKVPGLSPGPGRPPGAADAGVAGTVPTSGSPGRGAAGRQRGSCSRHFRPRGSLSQLGAPLHPVVGLRGHMVSPSSHAESAPPEPQSVALFGNAVTTDVSS